MANGDNAMKNKQGAELEALRAENARLRQALQTLEQTKHRDREQLEELVAERTRELSDINAQLRKEISERKLAETQARQHQERLAHVARLNTVGEMTSGLAHEINQPLAAIASYTQGCLHRLRNTPDPAQLPAQLKGTLEQIVVQAQRAANIVQHLRNFVTKGKPLREPTDLAQVVRLAISMVRSEIMKNEIELNITQDENLPVIEADPIQIEQVILNLLRNASEALTEVPPEQRRLQIDINSQDYSTDPHYVSLAISDSGPGISSIDEDKVSTPFFSTKEDGMGLGLAISRTIIEDHGGRLQHIANRDGGATFYFTLAITGRRNAPN
jgi:C4-dicarboxylate-specific signal transduction histidine kinase